VDEAMTPNPPEHTEDTALIRAALAGHSTALRVLVRRLLPVIHARVKTFLRTRSGTAIGSDDASDLVQQVWTTLMQEDGHALRAYDPTRGKSLEGYVGMICQRELWRAVEKLRAQKREGERQAVPLDERRQETVGNGLSGPEKVAAAREHLQALLWHLEHVLDARDRVVMRCLYHDAMSAEETASMLGVATQVVYKSQHRIRSAARAYRSRVSEAIAG